MSQIVKSFRVTEKATMLSEASGKYSFEVHPSASKLEIRRAVEGLFGKKVLNVNTMNCFGKVKRRRTNAAGRSSDWKKAVVTLAAGERIEIA
jgi:large subunit ribosomal protein L23